MDEKFAHVYKHAVRVARNVNVDPTMPRVVGRQIHRCNAPADNPEQYYQRNVAVPLINPLDTNHTCVCGKYRSCFYDLPLV